MPNYQLPPGIHHTRPESGPLDGSIAQLAWSPGGEILAISREKRTALLWNMATGEIVEAANAPILRNMAWLPDGETLAGITHDNKLYYWYKHGKWSQFVISIPLSSSTSLYPSFNDLLLLDTSMNSIYALAYVYDDQSFQVKHTLPTHAFYENALKLLISPNQQIAACITDTCNVVIWENILKSDALPKQTLLHKQCEGASDLAWSPDGSLLAVYGMPDDTILLLNAGGKKEKRLLRGHTDSIMSVVFSPDGRLLASKARDGVILFWRTDTWEIVATVTELVFEGDESGGLAFHPVRPILAVYGVEEKRGEVRGSIHLLSLDVEALLHVQPANPVGQFYKNARVVLVGDSGVGKSGLSLVLTGRLFAPTESTHGRHVWIIEKREIPLADGKSESHEILLWDLAGQPGYRLIHQLHLNEVSTALIVIDPHSETDPFAGVHHWVRALDVAERSSSQPIKKILVLARLDRGTLRVSKARVEELVQNLRLDDYVETSAKEYWGIEELRQKILSTIDWDVLPKVSSTPIFQRIHAFLLAEKESGRVLSTQNEMYQAFGRRARDLQQEENLRVHFETCIDQIEAQGLIRKLSFGNLVLLQPELIDVYASALVNAVRDEPDGLGSLAEETVRARNFFVPEAQRIMNKEQEKLLLIAMIEDLLRSEVAFRERVPEGPLLVFPSQTTRENPDLPDPEEKTVTFRFEGPLQNIYATLAVRLAHSGLFKKQALWRDAVTYTTGLGTGECGMLLSYRGEGQGELTLFADHEVEKTTRALFEAYVYAHLQQRSLLDSLERRPIIRCEECGTLFTSMQVERRKQRGFHTIVCSTCDHINSLAENADELLIHKARTIVTEMDHIADIQREREVIDSTHANRWLAVEDRVSQVLKTFFQEVEIFSSETLPSKTIAGNPSNPYYEYGAIRDPENFFSRKETLRSLYEAICRHQSVSLVGLPGIGKSSLLSQLQLPEVQAKYGYNLPNALFLWLDMKDPLISTPKGFLATICGRIVKQKPDEFESAQFYSMESDDAFAQFLEQIWLKGYYLVLLLDEFDSVQGLKEFNASFFSFLRTWASLGRISYITASIEPLHKVTAPLSKVAASPFFNIFLTLRMPPLTLYEARDLITIPARRAHLPFTEKETDWALEQAGRHPFFLQKVCQHLFDQKRLHQRTQLTPEELDLLQEQVYRELLPHFDNLWSYLNAEEKEQLRYAAIQNIASHWLPELSESGLFLQFIRKERQFLLPQMEVNDLRAILEHTNDTLLLGNCQIASWNIVNMRAGAHSSQAEKGRAVREVLNKVLEQLKGEGARGDTKPDWTLYNILYYRYFKYALLNDQIAARLSISVRHYYRLHTQAQERFLTILLDMERTSLGKDDVKAPDLES